jgi:peptidoglycan hydrolase-like protein with peptidoglycan-binding domain
MTSDLPLGIVVMSPTEDVLMPARPTVTLTLSSASVLASVIVLAACSGSATTGSAVEAATAPPTVTAAPTTTVPITTAPPAPVVTTTTTTVVTTTTQARPANVVTVPPAAEPIMAIGRDSGPEAARVQERLLELGFWLDMVDGLYGHVTRQAVMAFQKYWGLPATGTVDEVTAATLTTTTERARGLSEAGHLVEVDKARQLLFLVKYGHTVWTVNASTGTEVPYEVQNKKDPTRIEHGDSVTPVGWFATNREREQGWWEGDLGEIYRPKYFRGGVAVHGSRSIPNYPASRGCVRVSVAAMDMIWETGLVPLKTPVWVHGDLPSAPL